MKDINDISIVQAYLVAKKYLYRTGYFDEIEWQYNVDFLGVGEKNFLEEYAWVVLNSGMNERVVRKIFPNISSSFFNWTSAEMIINHETECKMNALYCFNNRKKIEAIIETAYLINRKNFKSFFDEVVNNGIEYLKKLPYIGSITSYHLAKNIGFVVSKPDRHLVKLANRLNYRSAEDICHMIHSYTDEPVSVVDLVLWRYSTLKRDFLDICEMNCTKKAKLFYD